MDEEKYAECAGNGTMIRPEKTLSLMTKLSEQEKDVEKKLADIKRIKQLLEKNPDIEEILTIIGRHRHLF